MKQLARTTSAGLMAGTILLTLIIWVLMSSSKSIPTAILPPPSRVIAQVREGPSSATWLRDILYSMTRVFVGFGIAVLIAIPVGLYAGYFAVVDALTTPIVEAGRYIPVPALIPLTILWIGIDESQKVVIIFLGTFFPLVAAVSDLTRSSDQQLVEVGRTLGQSDHSILWRIVRPSIAPGVFDALRIAVGWAWSYLVVAEIISSGVGIGYRIMSSQRYLQVGLVFAGLIILGGLGLATDLSFRAVKRAAFRWNF